MNAPAKTTVEYWRELTEENQHGLARVEISQWVSEQAFYLDDGERGRVTLRLAPQEAVQTVAFDWSAAATAELDLFEVAKMLEVFRGCSGSVNDGRGIFRRSDALCTVVQVAHRVEPAPGYFVEIARKSVAGGETRKVGILLTATEAFALSLALEGSMGRIAFGG